MINVLVGIVAATLSIAQPQINEFTYDEAQLMMHVAQAESGNQGSDGMWLTMSVLVNRMKFSEFPDTLEGVVFQSGQFSTVTNGAIYTVEPSPECHEALARIERGDVAPQIIAFENVDSNYLDSYFTSAFEYRDHRFYTLKK